MEVLFISFVILAIITILLAVVTVVGHIMWLSVAAFLRFLFPDDAGAKNDRQTTRLFEPSDRPTTRRFELSTTPLDDLAVT